MSVRFFSNKQAYNEIRICKNVSNIIFYSQDDRGKARRLNKFKKGITLVAIPILVIVTHNYDSITIEITYSAKLYFVRILLLVPFLFCSVINCI